MRKNTIIAVTAIVLVFGFFVSRTLLHSPLNSQRSFSPPIMSTTTSSSKSIDSSLPMHTVGQVTRHPSPYVSKIVLIKGYLLKKEAGYLIFSDEANGLISRYDLPITGQGIEQITQDHAYLVEGIFLGSGLAASNGNPYHLELSAIPRMAH